jgi:hypothetical protein
LLPIGQSARSGGPSGCNNKATPTKPGKFLQVGVNAVDVTGEVVVAILQTQVRVAVEADAVAERSPNNVNLLYNFL